MDAESTTAIELNEDDIAPLLSDYLDSGYKKDVVKIRRIIVDPPSATATLDVLDYFMPGDGEYHFTSIHAMIVVSQIGIVLAIKDNELEAKPGEIYMREFTILCRRKINKTEGIRMSVRLARRVEAAGIAVRPGSVKLLSEEAPYAYKDVDEVVDVCHRAGLATKVARLVPIGVVKG